MEETGYTLINELDPSEGVEAADLLITQKDGEEFKATASQLKAYTSPAATTTNDGVITTGSQSLKGAKTFTDPITAAGATFTEDTLSKKDHTVEGTLYVKGDIIQQGSSYETEVETLKVKDQMIVTREGATESMAAGELTGIKATLYDGENNGILAFDKDGIGRIGDEGDEQAIATREDNPTDKAAAVWDDTTKKYVSKPIDNTVTAGSTNLITSGAVKSALTKTNVGLGNVTNVATTSTIQSGSEDNITSGAVYTALSNKMDNKEIDTEATSGSTNLITSGAVKAAIDATPGSRPVDDLPTEGSTNFVTSGGIATALAGKMENKTIDTTPVVDSMNLITSNAVCRVGRYFSTSCSTSASEQIKEITIENLTLVNGDIIGVTFVNENSYGDCTLITPTYPTLKLNSGSAIPICDSLGHTVGKGCWNSGDYIELRYCGNKFVIINSDVRQKDNVDGGLTVFSNNTKVYDKTPILLWSGSASSDSVTLSESANNFEFLRFEIFLSGSLKLEYQAPISSIITWSQIAYTGSWYLNSLQLGINNKTVSISAYNVSWNLPIITKIYGIR